ncbi:hypothetical protein [Zavarzinella formosa]|uniref:hypothetical protein n=1 Tax=Zavarzinella formosa TaxID=360055 RepID=UPI0002D60AD3|nr:hypothetical protein [Zavarzinella formosa]
MIDETARAQETTRIAPASGGVEIDRLQIVRLKVLGAVKRADLTNMQLDLWFAADWKKTDDDVRPLIHLQSLDAIEDDTGRLLSTENRLKEISYLQGETRGTHWKGSGETSGPAITMLLDAPGRGAAKIKSIKGKGQVSLTKPVNLTFENLADINGKDLDHPDMKGLAAMKFRFSITEKDGNVTAKLSAPVQFASPWNQGRLFRWDLMNGKRTIDPSSEGRTGKGTTEEKTYRRQSLKGLSLRLVVLEATETKDFSFDFKDVELP